MAQFSIFTALIKAALNLLQHGGTLRLKEKKLYNVTVVLALEELNPYKNV